MGKRRFEIYEEMTTRAVSILNQKLSKLGRDTRMSRSGSQLSQMSADDETPQIEESEQNSEVFQNGPSQLQNSNKSNYK